MSQSSIPGVSPSARTCVPTHSMQFMSPAAVASVPCGVLHRKVQLSRQISTINERS
jgi:hypothetical protein